jgi:hypothetical protein
MWGILMIDREKALEQAIADEVAQETAALEPRELVDMMVATRLRRDVADDKKQWIKQHLMGLRHAELQRTLARRFGAERGWTLSSSAFSLRTLSRGKRHGGRYILNGDGFFEGSIADCFDHPYWFRHDGAAAAIAAHLYGFPHNKADCEAVAAEYGLRFETPDFPSWWYPGGTTLVVYVGPAGGR